MKSEVTVYSKLPHNHAVEALGRWSLRQLAEIRSDCLQQVASDSTSLVLRPRDYVTKLVSGPLACELPLYGNPVAIHTTIPGPSLLAQASDVSDSAFA